jgi:RNase H-fold protein (predicted Holliday junction resolvase)
LINLEFLFQTKHCRYVDNFIKYLQEQGNLKIPVTLVNENSSTVKAKEYLIDQQQKLNLDPNSIFEKQAWDKIAAEVILDRFLVYFNKENESQMNI